MHTINLITSRDIKVSEDLLINPEGQHTADINTSTRISSLAILWDMHLHFKAKMLLINKLGSHVKIWINSLSISALDKEMAYV